MLWPSWTCWRRWRRWPLKNNYCRPVVDDSDELTITEGRHPVVEQMLKGSLFVPNDTKLNCTTDRCLIITGRTWRVNRRICARTLLSL